MVQSELSTNLSHVVLSLVLAFAIVADRGCGSAAVLKPQRVVSSIFTCTVQLTCKVHGLRCFWLQVNFFPGPNQDRFIQLEISIRMLTEF